MSTNEWTKLHAQLSQPNDSREPKTSRVPAFTHQSLSGTNSFGFEEFLGELAVLLTELLDFGDDGSSRLTIGDSDLEGTGDTSS
jgi:hypothetical protein